MFYYLIFPPIIIVVSLVVLVYFFSRHFPSVEQEITERLDEEAAKSTQKNHFFGMMRKAFLHILEHFMQWVKVRTLRIYNKLNHWTQSLHVKKNEVIEKTRSDIPKISKCKVKQRSEKNPMPDKNNRDCFTRPMVSQKITQPDIKESVVTPIAAIDPVVVKNQLEDILVERIAINPRDLEAYERLGEYYMENGNLQDAKECYRQVLRLSPVYHLAKIKIRRLEKLLEQKEK
jgi:tetratricopeptide (TPR) repeat protein